MSMNAIFVLEPNHQSLLSLLATPAPPVGNIPGKPHSIHESLKLLDRWLCFLTFFKKDF